MVSAGAISGATSTDGAMALGPQADLDGQAAAPGGGPASDNTSTRNGSSTPPLESGTHTRMANAMLTGLSTALGLLLFA